MMTPYDKLKSIENVKNYLKPDITFEVLDKVALSQNDDQMAEQLQKERSKLFNPFIGFLFWVGIFQTRTKKFAR